MEYTPKVNEFRIHNREVITQSSKEVQKRPKFLCKIKKDGNFFEKKKVLNSSLESTSVEVTLTNKDENNLSSNNKSSIFDKSTKSSAKKTKILLNKHFKSFKKLEFYDLNKEKSCREISLSNSKVISNVISENTNNNSASKCCLFEIKCKKDGSNLVPIKKEEFYSSMSNIFKSEKSLKVGSGFRIKANNQNHVINTEIQKQFKAKDNLCKSLTARDFTSNSLRKIDIEKSSLAFKILNKNKNRIESVNVFDVKKKVIMN